jgi:hypothetical protein
LKAWQKPNRKGNNQYAKYAEYGKKYAEYGKQYAEYAKKYEGYGKQSICHRICRI